VIHIFKPFPFQVDWASQAYCNYAIFVGVVSCVTCFYFAVRSYHYLKKDTDASFFAAFCEVLAEGFLSVLSLVSALIITFGFKRWCDEMSRRFERCSDATGHISNDEHVDSSDFFFHMSLCQAGMWLTFVGVFTGFAFSTLKLCRYHARENVRVSMARERRRLIAGDPDLVADVPPPRPPPPSTQAGQRSSMSETEASSSTSETMSKRARARALVERIIRRGRSGEEAVDAGEADDNSSEPPREAPPARPPAPPPPPPPRRPTKEVAAAKASPIGNEIYVCEQDEQELVDDE